MKVQDEIRRVNRMLRLILLGVVLVVLYIAIADANIICGVKPIPPIGCEAVCTDRGWIFICGD